MDTAKPRRIGESTGVAPQQDLPKEAEAERTDEGYDRAIRIGRHFVARYRRTMAILSA